MTTTKLYLDTRAAKDGRAPIKVVITKKGRTALLSTGIKVLESEWDKQRQVVTGADNAKKLNLFLTRFKLRIDDILLNAQEDGSFAGLNATQIKGKIQSVISPQETPAKPVLFYERYKSFAESRTAARTKEIYETTLKRISEYDSDYESLQFSDIDKRWLSGFDAHLAKTSPSENARNIHFRNIRAVFNDAIDDEVTANYPFRKFRIKNIPTVKRSLNTAQVRNLFTCSPWRVYQEYLDIFKLMFYLCGINLIDLCNLTEKNVINGRIEYKRAKTGKIYSVRIEPEADEIIQQYRGEKYLLNIRDRYKNHKDYMKHINKGLSKIGNVIGKEKNGVPIMQPICSSLSTYWARHTWATIAAELDIPKETIAAGLGHNIGSPITSIYIDFNQKKVDEANRRIIDYILYNEV